MVSIIVPVFNSSEKLSRCIGSILRQSYWDFELLLIDDGSTDNSVEICQSYVSSDARVQYIYKENGGSATARNLGIQRARGEYIQFIDSDDFVEPDITQNLLDALTEDDSDMAICGLVTHTEYTETSVLFGDRKSLTLNEFSQWVAKFYTSGIIHSSCTKLYKRALINSLMNPKFRYGEDLFFNLEYLLNVRKVTIIDKALYHYDCTGDSVTRGKYICQRESIETLYAKSIICLERLFHSEAVNSVASVQYFKDLFADMKNSSTIWHINSQTVASVIESNGEAIDRIIPTDKLSRLLAQKDIPALLSNIRKDMFISMCRQCVKRILRTIRGL